MTAVKTWFGYGVPKLRNVGEVSGEEISGTQARVFSRDGGSM
jgi:hypothetical protein